MHSFSVKELDQLIENDLKEKKKSSKLLIGYKLFHDLMSDPKFYADTDCFVEFHGALCFVGAKHFET